MADKYLNETGVQVIKTWAEGKFALDADLDTLSERVEEIVAEGGEPNVIETVKVNGTALVPDAQKAVNVEAAQISQDIVIGPTGPTDRFRLTIGDGKNRFYMEEGNNSEYTFGMTSRSASFYPAYHIQDTFATKEYVDENGGKIDVIKVNGATQTITNKAVDLNVPTVEVFDNSSGDTTALNSTIESDTGTIQLGVRHDQYNDIKEFTAYISNNEGECDITIPSESTILDMITNAVPTNVSQLTNDSDFQTEAQVQALIDSELEGITGIDFQVVDTLPTTGAKGIIYLVHKGGAASDIYDEYIWVVPATGDPHYEQIGTTDIDLSDYWSKTELQAMTVAEIQAILNA